MMAQKNFYHPFEPYDIQQQFMQTVYDCIEHRKFGILESPTGTGKSLSLICGSLTWLREHKRKALDEDLASIRLEDDEPEWIIEQARERRKREARQLRADFETRLRNVREQEKKIREQHSFDQPSKKRRRDLEDNVANLDNNEESFVLAEYDSGNEHSSIPTESTIYSAHTRDMMQRLGILPHPSDGRDAALHSEETKIFFCSRTHSQLSQLVGELQRVRLPPGIPEDPTAGSPNTPLESTEPLKHLALGSRKSLCINPKVKGLSSQTAVNERCIELQQSNAASGQGCPYLPSKKPASQVLDFRDHALAKIRDIEDLALAGSKLQICPYYASRSAIGHAEMITLPYPLLLQKAAREALGISLKDHVVIIDEAHNLMDAIESICSTQVSHAQLTRSRDSLISYLKRFRNRLKGQNRIYVTQVVKVIDSLIACATKLSHENRTGGSIVVDDLLGAHTIDHINFSKLVRYLNQSKLARKVDGYVSLVNRNQDSAIASTISTEMPDVPTLVHVQNFIMTLVNPSKEGQFLWSRDKGYITLQYLLLDSSEHFRDVVEEARAVILAGGTMSPMDDYKFRLCPYLPSSSITTLSCGHLIPNSSLLVRIIASDPSGTLNFSFKNRGSASNPARIGSALLDIAPKIDGGVVVFFPSYGFLTETICAWRDGSTMKRINDLLPVFCDGRNDSADDVFSGYKEAVLNGPKGAIMLSVIGGKLSEGINFSDRLGRCVIMVGLPFPNMETPEWKARLHYINEHAASEANNKAGREYVENTCMRSVNQAIGRVIRHKSDWASIILMDERYAQDRITSKLPGWIKEGLPKEASPSLNDVVGDVQAFFNVKTARNLQEQNR